MSLRDQLGLKRVGGKLTSKFQKPADPSVQAPAKQPAKPKKQKPQLGGLVHENCGHPVIIKGKCGACMAVANKERKARKRAKQAEKGKRQPNMGRLPLGSSFAVTYIEDGLWTGNLDVLLSGVDGCIDKRFTGEASGVFRLLMALDGQYREWLREKEKGIETKGGI